MLETTGSTISITTNSSLLEVVGGASTGQDISIFGSTSILIAGGKGNDTINLHDTANDTVLAGDGNDVIGGGAGNDSIDAGAGDDWIFGGPGNQTLIGGDGNDTIFAGSSGNQSLVAGAGDDVLYGNGTSSLYAGSGNDTLYGSSDHLYGSTGVGGHADMHVGNGGTIDSNSAVGGYNVLGSNTTAGQSATLNGGAGDDWIFGGAGSDVLHAGSGNTVIVSGAATNQVQGGAGDDTLVSAYTGFESMDGGSGDNYFKGLADTSGGGTMSAGSGNDTFWAWNGGSYSMVGGEGDNEYHIQNHSGNNTIMGGSGVDVVGFDNRSQSEVLDLSGSAGNYTLVFTDGQTTELHNVDYLYFSGDNSVQKLP